METKNQSCQILKVISKIPKAFRNPIIMGALTLISASYLPAQQQDFKKYEIALKSRTFTPQPGFQASLKDSIPLRLAQGIKQYVIIQFKEIPSITLRKKLEAKGVHLLSYINGYAYYASVIKPDFINFETLTGRAGKTFKTIRWIGNIENTDRVDSVVLNGKFGEWAINDDGSVKIRIVFFEDVDSAIQNRILNTYSKQSAEHSINIWQIHIDRNRIPILIRENSINWIEQEPAPYQPLNDITRNVVGVNNVQKFNPATSTYDGYSGDGIQVLIRDMGIDWDGNGNDHEDFDGRVLITNTPDSYLCHGTHVAGILAGSGFRSNLNNTNGISNGGTAYQWRGMAPEAQIAGFYFGWDGVTYNNAKANYGVDISNHSHVQDCNSGYTTDASVVDNIIVLDTLYICAAAANSGDQVRNCGNLEGYFSIIGSVAKNALCVGSYNSANGLRSEFSSMGPTFDGRIKPDIVAPGSNITSTVYDDERITNPEFQDDGYGVMSGTSMATPCVSGSLALMLEAFWATHGINKSRPLFSTMKAILIETAHDLVQTPNTSGEPDCPDFIGSNAQPPFFHIGPDWATGYGLINTESAVNTICNNYNIKKLYIEDAINNKAEVDEFLIIVPAGTPELKVTMAWDDAPGSLTTANTTPKIVNDLNIVLIGPDGRTKHYPWILPPLDPANDGDINPADIKPAITGEDHVNNVEQVLVTNPQGGFWIVRVYESGLPTPPQSYSLATNIPFTILRSRFSLSLHSGVSVPTGSFTNNYKVGPNFIFDLGYRISRSFDLVLYTGINLFKSDVTGIPDNRIVNISLNLKYNKNLPLLTTNKLYIYVQAGPGYYIPQAGSNKLGFNAGLGFDYHVSPHLYLEVGTDYHKTFNDIQFSANHAGVIYNF
jgi:subtilisin family serine protease